MHLLICQLFLKALTVVLIHSMYNNNIDIIISLPPPLSPLSTYREAVHLYMDGPTLPIDCPTG